MPNQAPHTPTPGFQIRPPVITKELQEAYNNIKKVSPKAMAILEERERKQQELELQKQNQLQDYTEVAWLKVLNQDLDKPQCPQVKLLKEWEDYQECCCYELEDETGIYYQYDWYWAMKESGFRWLKLLSTEDWDLLEKELWINWLKDFLNLKKEDDYRGCYNSETNEFEYEDEACYWSDSSTSPNYSWSWNLGYFNDKVKCCTDDNYKIFSVRCRLRD